MSKREFTLAYGKKEIKFKLDEKNLLGVLLPEKITPEEDEKTIIENALKNPVKSAPLAEIVSPKSEVAIITSDITRSTPSSKMLPPLLNELERAGVKRKNIKIIFALGAHRKHTEEEKKYLVGEKIYENYRCIDHEKENCVSLGKTKSGIPVEIFKEVNRADVKICLGNIEPHYFAGYTGGAKSIMPGVSSKISISETHKLMLSPLSCAGKLDGNPTREAIEEVGEKVGIEFILNVVLNPQKEVVAAFAGDKTFAHRKGCEVADTCFKVKIKQKADIVIVSCGGYPKDINVYQAQKALDNAKYAVKEGGTIILVGECREGFGDKIFEEWMLEATSFRDPVEKLKKEFVLGGHKAAAIGMLLEKAKVIFVSSLPPSRVRKLFFTPANTLDEAISIALEEYGKDASFYIIPSGGITLPYPDKS
ncbi:MAG TPA: nickel-dependent lactate racemase [Candidatus Aerophobetes bacterium]|uniref:Nickel-dependent lactate racemase n=1 Tax=Aerophobetes bacterium TaxID=2030807 RepID=A0A7V5HZQ8_UNCAE|nr:nickel-dependent lactate racemase [Candidatus Aerophobetes bacterium]